MDVKDDFCNMHMGKHVHSVHRYDIRSLEPLLLLSGIIRCFEFSCL